MSTDEDAILFPVNKLKAETLRSMAKDLGVVPGGRKVELIQRLRASSASGWTTPIKRKSECFEIPLNITKRSRTATISPKTPRTLVPLSSPSPRRLRRIRGAEVVEECPQKDPLLEDDPSTEEDDAPNEEKSHDQGDLEPTLTVFDDYLIFGPTSAFITGDDLLAMVDRVSVTALTLWKVTSTLTERDKIPLQTVDLWLIPAHGGDRIQNVTAFKETYKDVLEKLRALKAAETNGRNETPDGVVTADGEQPSKRRWYEVSISRNLGKGALAVTLIKGTVEGKGIFPIMDAKEESGAFWVSGLSAARQDDSETLEREAKLLF